MPDLTSISAALTSIKSATEIAKMLKNADTSLEKAEMKLQIAELMEALAESKINISEVQQLIIEKDEKIKELEESLELKENIIFEEPFYFLEKEGNKEGPFCQKCLDGDDNLVRLLEINDYGGTHYCKVCESFYGPTKKRSKFS